MNGEEHFLVRFSDIGNAPSDLPVYPEVPYAFFGFYLAASTYSTFGILRFTVLSRLGRAEPYQSLAGRG
jgi:hypothetical protein